MKSHKLFVINIENYQKRNNFGMIQIINLSSFHVLKSHKLFVVSIENYQKKIQIGSNSDGRRGSVHAGHILA